MLHPRLALPFAIVTAWLPLPASAFAAAPAYFDIGGLLLWPLGLVLGLVVFPIGIAASKSLEAKGVCALLSLTCLVAIALPIVNGRHEMQRMEDGVSIDADAFGKYCVNDRRVVNAQPPARAISLRVRNERESAAPRWIAGAPGLARRIREDPSFCSQSGLVTVVNQEPAKGEEAAYAVCAAEAAPDGPAPVQYELLIRDSYTKEKGTGQVPWGLTEMYKSSIRVTREIDKQVVAEADFSFVSPRIVQIEARCPNATSEILKFLAATLPRG